MRSLPVVRGVSRTSTFPGPRRLALCTLLVVAGLGVFADDASAQRRFRPWRADEVKFDTLLKEMAIRGRRPAGHRRVQRRPQRRRGDRLARPPLGAAPVEHARPLHPDVQAAAAPAGAARRCQARALRPAGRGAARPFLDHGGRQDRAGADGLRRQGHRGRGDRLGGHAQPRGPALRRQLPPSGSPSSSTSSTARPPATTTGVTARTWPVSSPATATTRTAPAPASPPGPRWSPSRRSTARVGAGSATSSRRSTGRWPTAPPTTSASSTCRSARGCSSPTTPTR